MRRIFNLCAIFVLTISCEKNIETNLQPTPDAELGEDFKIFESWIDLTQTNQFNESLFVNNWILSQVTRETYVDGVLTKTQDVTDLWATSEYSIMEDHTIRTKSSKGIWLYSHNILMLNFNRLYYNYEVVESRADILSLKAEEYPEGIDISPYHKDKSGTHHFNIFEYIGCDD